MLRPASMTTWIGSVGLVSFALAWIPQSWETIREGRCGANRSFLALSALGSLFLAGYAFLRGDAVFASLNALTTAGALVNVYFSLFPRASGSRGNAPSSADDKNRLFFLTAAHFSDTITE